MLMSRSVLLLILLLAACAPAADVPERKRAWFDAPQGRRVFDYVERNGQAIVHGDISFPLPPAADQLGGAHPEFEEVRSAALTPIGPLYRWPGGLVPYVIDASMSAVMASRVQGALGLWGNAGVRFVPYTGPSAGALGSSRLHFREVTGYASCQSPVGRQPSVNYIDLNSACAEGSGAVAHEIGHSLGLWHEQMRPDRDAYVTIDFDNIPLHLHDEYEVLELGAQPQGAYDVGSIMHYDGRSVYAVDPQNDVVMVYAGTDDPVVGNRVAPTRGDKCAARAFNGIGAGSDINNDGRADLVLGVPGATVSTILNDAGAIRVALGTQDGLSASPTVLHRDSTGVEDSAGAEDELGTVVAFGDFDGDCYADVAVGVPGDTVNGLVGAGSVHVFRGGLFGLRTDDDTVWHPAVSGVAGEVHSGMAFGAVITSGDFDGDGFDDLAIGAPQDRVGTVLGAGSVTILYGSSTGVTAARSHELVQGAALADVPETDERFGAALAVGDFDADGFDDLAIGVPYESVGTWAGAGLVHALYGARSGLSLVGDQVLSASSVAALPISGPAVSLGPNALFGFALTSGDFNRDGSEDLAIGAPLADVANVIDAGTVTVLYGQRGANLQPGAQLWHQGVGQVAGVNEPSDTFGRALAAGDFDADGDDDLAIGVPYDTIYGAAGAGGVTVIEGAFGGLTDVGSVALHQSTSDVGSTAEAGDLFGYRLRVADYDGDGHADLAVAVPYEDGGLADVGVVHVFFGDAEGVEVSGSDLWSIERWAGVAEAVGNRFGLGL